MPGAVFPHKGKIIRKSIFFNKISIEPTIEFWCGKCMSKTETEFVEINYPRFECRFCRTINIMPYFFSKEKENTILIEADKNFIMEN